MNSKVIYKDYLIFITHVGNFIKMFNKTVNTVFSAIFLLGLVPSLISIIKKSVDSLSNKTITKDGSRKDFSLGFGVL